MATRRVYHTVDYPHWKGLLILTNAELESEPKAEAQCSAIVITTSNTSIVFRSIVWWLRFIVFVLWEEG